MKLNLSDENFRELLDSHNLPSDSVEIDALRADVLKRLRDHDYGRVYTQSAGAFEIFQGGTAEEREAFSAAVDAEIESRRSGK